MKFYEIELKRESYVTVIVSANSPEDAAEKLWNNLTKYVDGNVNDADWDITEINEAGRTE